MIESFLQSETHLANLSSWLEAAFAVNLAYSALIAFGKFSGDSLCRWADTEKLRVIPALAEDERFNEPRFSGDIDDLEEKSLKAIKIINKIALAWALFASFFLFILLIYSAFDQNLTVSPGSNWLHFVFLSGAVPLGLLALVITHGFTRKKMKRLSSEFDALIRYSTKAPQEQVRKAKDALARKIKERRDQNS